MILYLFVKTGAKTYKKSRQEVTPFQLVNDNVLNESRAISYSLLTSC